jgi:hypothetical protein
MARCLAYIALAAIAGCGVRGQPSETSIDSGEVPFDLLGDNPGSAEPPLVAEPGGGSTTIFLESAGVLVPVQRDLPAPIRAADALRALAAGPTPEEEAFGVQTAITSGDAATSVRTDGALAVVRLGDAFFREGADQVTALAQIVFTLTGFERVSQVRFLVGTEAAEVPRADGVLTAEPVTRDDYAALAPSATGT